jgi:hypothetical protein
MRGLPDGGAIGKIFVLKIDFLLTGFVLKTRIVFSSAIGPPSS